MWGGILLAGVLLGAGADRLDPNDLAARVQELVRKLDASELAQRQVAEDALLKLGPRALEFLPQASDVGNAEVAQRLRRVRQKLEHERAAAGVQPSRIALRGKMTLANLLAALEQQTGNKISTARLDGSARVLPREIDADFQQTPFWPALDQVLAQAGLDIYPYGQRGAVELAAPAAPRPPAAGHVSYAGPFRFQVVSVLAQRELKAPETRSLKVEIEVAWEPRLAPINLTQRLADVRAIDERGNPLPVDTPKASLDVPVPRGPIAARLLLPLALPPREVRTIAELRGTLAALLPGPVERFRFTDLGRGAKASKRVAGVSVTLEDSTTLGKSLEARLLVRFDQPGDALASHRTWIFNNPVYLESRDKKTVASESIQPTRHTADEVGIAVTFPVDGAADDYTLVYHTPTTIVTAPLEYRFRDIPLP